ncbi:MAG: EamA/RhaT family transporter [Bacillales bacterium]|nr:EamA/RhaT family transporter [Bacillales bacterium]
MINKTNPPIPIFFTISIIAISFAAIFVKMANTDPSITSMYRMWLSSAILLPFVYIKRKEIPKIDKKVWLGLFLSGIFLSFHFVLWFSSLEYTSVASSTMILATQPIISLLFGFFLYKERTNLSSVISMCVAIFGVCFIGFGDIGFSDKALFGDFLSFLSVIAVVGYLLFGQNIVKGLSHWIYTFFVFFFSSIVLTIYNLFKGLELTGYNAYDWKIFILLAIVPSVAHIINNWLLNYVNATTISMSILGEPVGASILAYIFLHEVLSITQIIGGMFVLVGVWTFLMKQKANNKNYEILNEDSSILKKDLA